MRGREKYFKFVVVMLVSFVFFSFVLIIINNSQLPRFSPDGSCPQGVNLSLIGNLNDLLVQLDIYCSAFVDGSGSSCKYDPISYISVEPANPNPSQVIARLVRFDCTP